MKKIILSLSICVLFSSSLFPQVVNDFEGGDEDSYTSDCWEFNGVFFDDSNSIGTYAMSTGPLTDDAGVYSIITPWVDIPTNGVVSFKTGLINSNFGSDENNAKELSVFLLSEDSFTPLLLDEKYTTSELQDKSIQIPTTGLHRLQFVWYGKGSSNRAVLDDLSISGELSSDPCEEDITDSDGDTVPDDEDDYPDDPNKAYDNFYPGENSFNTLAYEDLWPSQGDYDFNDLVVDYRFNEITNANNAVVEIVAVFYVRAVGGSFDNGFAIQFDDLLPSDIAFVNGQAITGNLYNIDANGTEANQTKAVIPVFDSAENVINRVGGSMYNTIPTNGTGISDTITMVIGLSSPKAFVGYAPYNPFLIKNQQRNIEVHLADKVPTDLIDVELLGTNNDDSNPGLGKYYKNVNNLPWALDVASTFEYPIENADIIDAYLNFELWAQSNGTNFTDWYTNTTSEYRNSALIFQ
ncbi:MAG: LruC domain-containing protein [Winogradskyella sp.]|uniref:LruC domain-containing protein n=1 Tax=Winogradskyella sp. TaxID=1883156 RepID=UPI0025F3C8E6|nr:LruC domain-containing protein [Winogradskyella sp.]NRB60461.1 LruC domain-containing protein [Winogradskyella sp.]